MPKILIADNEYFFDVGLRQYLYTKLEYELSGVVSNEQELFAACQKENIDILFLRDWWDCAEKFSATISQLKASFPKLKIIVLANNFLRAFEYVDQKLPIDGCLLRKAQPKNYEECLAQIDNTSFGIVVLANYYFIEGGIVFV